MSEFHGISSAYSNNIVDYIYVKESI